MGEGVKVIAALSKTRTKHCGKSDSCGVLSPFCFCLKRTCKLCLWFGAMAFHLFPACQAWSSYHTEILHLGFVGPEIQQTLLNSFWNSGYATSQSPGELELVWRAWHAWMLLYGQVAPWGVNKAGRRIQPFSREEGVIEGRRKVHYLTEFFAENTKRAT